MKNRNNFKMRKDEEDKRREREREPCLKVMSVASALLRFTFGAAPLLLIV